MAFVMVEIQLLYKIMSSAVSTGGLHGGCLPADRLLIQVVLSNLFSPGVITSEFLPSIHTVQEANMSNEHRLSVGGGYIIY
jgi:hypothetical protein